MKIGRNICLCLTLLCCLVLSSWVTKKQKPNIVLILGPAQGHMDYGFNESYWVKTPNLDSICKQGVLFTNGYNTSNESKNSSRTLLTGLYPHDYQVLEDEILQKVVQSDSLHGLNPKEKKEYQKNFKDHSLGYFHSLPMILSEKGYRSFQYGKWHEYHYKYGRFDAGTCAGSTLDNIETDTSITKSSNRGLYDFIDACNEDPFFVLFSPEFGMDSVSQDLYTDISPFLSESASKYAKECKWFDHKVGELTSYISNKTLKRPTIYIYMAGAGYDQEPESDYALSPDSLSLGGDKGLYSNFDLSYHTPIIFQGQDFLSGHVYNDIISTVNIFPTILELAGVKKLEFVEGQSLYKSLYKNSTPYTSKHIIGAYTQLRNSENKIIPSKGYWLRTENWFYTLVGNSFESALYNVEHDPRTSTDISKQFPDKNYEFKQAIQDWIAVKGQK